MEFYKLFKEPIGIQEKEKQKNEKNEENRQKTKNKMID